MSENSSVSGKVKEISVGLIVSWIVGIILFIIGIPQIFLGNFFAGFFFLLSAVIALPITSKILEEKYKSKLSKGVKILFIIIFIIIGSISVPTDQPTNTLAPDNQNNLTTDQKPITTEETKPAPKTVIPTETVKSKTYQQIFTFSGNGTKKSEPFTVVGSRFKIKYNCSGDLCQAFLYKVGSSFPQVIMNAMGSTNDETIIYGSGEYYLEANIVGSYTMTVEDYK